MNVFWEHDSEQEYIAALVEKGADMHALLAAERVRHAVKELLAQTARETVGFTPDLDTEEGDHAVEITYDSEWRAFKLNGEYMPTAIMSIAQTMGWVDTVSERVYMLPHRQEWQVVATSTGKAETQRPITVCFADTSDSIYEIIDNHTVAEVDTRIYEEDEAAWYEVQAWWDYEYGEFAEHLHDLIDDAPLAVVHYKGKEWRVVAEAQELSLAHEFFAYEGAKPYVFEAEFFYTPALTPETKSVVEELTSAIKSEHEALQRQITPNMGDIEDVNEDEGDNNGNA